MLLQNPMTECKHFYNQNKSISQELTYGIHNTSLFESDTISRGNLNWLGERSYL